MTDQPDQPDLSRHGGSSQVDEDTFKLIKTSAIPDITEVRYYTETIEHIREQHVEFSNYLPSLDYAINDAVENPTHVYQTNTSPRSAGFRYVSYNSTYEGHPIVVIVKPIETASGLLKTAYFSGQETGNLLYSVPSPPPEPDVND